MLYNSYMAKDEFFEEILRGTYEYFEDQKSYSQENFRVERGEDATMRYHSEILSRVRTGKFLKIYVDYQVSQNFDPIEVKVTKSLGEQVTKEFYWLDLQTRTLTYRFTNNEGEDFKDQSVLTGKFQIVTPSFATSLLMTQSKKMDNIGRTPCNLITCENTWHANKTFVEKTVFLESRSHENVNLNVNGKTLNCTECHMYESDVGEDKNEPLPIIYHLSNHVGLPYKADFQNGITFVVKNLKVTESKTETYEIN